LEKVLQEAQALLESFVEGNGLRFVCPCNVFFPLLYLMISDKTLVQYLQHSVSSLKLVCSFSSFFYRTYGERLRQTNGLGIEQCRDTNYVYEPTVGNGATTLPAVRQRCGQSLLVGKRRAPDDFAFGPNRTAKTRSVTPDHNEKKNEEQAQHRDSVNEVD
jgi:hypothetical protein